MADLHYGKRVLWLFLVSCLDSQIEDIFTRPRYDERRPVFWEQSFHWIPSMS